MAKRSRDSGGLAANPPALLRWATSKALNRITNPHHVQRRRAKVERQRQRAGEPHVVEYFHQVDDGYSHLAAQLLTPLLDAYDVELVCHLVPAQAGPNAPEPDLLARLSRYDAGKIAPHYALTFPEAAAPQPALTQTAQRVLAGAPDARAFARAAPLAGQAIWSGAEDALRTLANGHTPADATSTDRAIAAGAARRSSLGHYSGAMFYYGKEWYWGVDRLHHLERRLADLGARKPGAEWLAPRPDVETGPLQDDGSLTLEIYASIRSPYTAMVFDVALDLARRTGVRAVVRPVLPMVMRGVPATRAKGVYIFTDAAREAAAHGVEWGNFYDPIGEPALRCYALYPWAVRQGRGVALLSAFLRAAFMEGVNTNTAAGLRHVVEQAGLDWPEARSRLDRSTPSNTPEEIEANRLAMYELGLWGVPSFRLVDASGETTLAVWGQDRLWLVSREIQRLLRLRRLGAAAP